MPPELTRAEKALRDAVVTIAGTKPISEVSVSEVCRSAGVTRDSFYRFAASPGALLGMYLYDDHDVTAVTPPMDQEGHAVRGLTPATRILIEHVQRNQVIYRNALTPRLPLELRDALLRRLETVLYAHATAFPEKLPDIMGRRPESTDVDVFVNHASNGVVGALEVLVVTDLLDDVDRSIAVLHAATAPWWLTYG